MALQRKFLIPGLEDYPDLLSRYEAELVRLYPCSNCQLQDLQAQYRDRIKLRKQEEQLESKLTKDR